MPTMTPEQIEIQAEVARQLAPIREQLAAAEQRAAQAEEKVRRLEQLHNMQTLNWSLHNKTQAEEIEKKAAAQAEREAVRECEKIAMQHLANASHVAYRIRNRWPQHFKEVE